MFLDMNGGIALFETHPAYASAIARMLADLNAMSRSRSTAANAYGAPDRLTYIIERFDRIAVAFLELVSDLPGQKAYQSLLEGVWRLSWEEFTGGPIETLRPASSSSDDALAAILARVRHWVGEGYQRVARLTAAPETPEEQLDGVVGRLPEITKWEDIQISFVSEFRIEINSGKSTANFNFTEFGFEDRRSPGKPNREWEILRELAECGGMLRGPGAMASTWGPVEKRVQRLRKKLRQHFHISGEPLPYISGTGYVAQFKIGYRPSYHK